MDTNIWPWLLLGAAAGATVVVMVRLCVVHSNYLFLLAVVPLYVAQVYAYYRIFNYSLDISVFSMERILSLLLLVMIVFVLFKEGWTTHQLWIFIVAILVMLLLGTSHTPD